MLAGTRRYVSLRERGCTQGVVTEYFSRLSRIKENKYGIDFALDILTGLSFEITIQAFDAAGKTGTIVERAEWFDF